MATLTGGGRRPHPTMANDPTSAPAGRCILDSLVLGVAALVVYFGMPQHALHGTDWRWLVLWLDEPGAVHPQHPGYLPLAKGLRWLLTPCGFDTHGVLSALSALGGACAVLGAHRAALALAGDRWFAAAAALLVLWTPAVFHFSTVVELHAPFAGAMAFAVLFGVHWARTGAPGQAVRTGVLTGVATLLHATGQLLVPGIALGVLWARRGHGFWRWLNGALLCAGTHACVFGGTFAAMRLTGHLPTAVEGFATVPDDPGAPNTPLAYLLRSFAFLRPEYLGPTLCSEWLLPFAPLSLLVLLAARRPGRRAPLALFLSLFVVYLLVALVLVHGATDERGAYLIPLAWPAAWFALDALPRRAWPALLLATAAAGFLCRGEPGRRPPDLAFGRAAVALAHRQPVQFFVADFPELDGIWLVDPRIDPRVARKEFDDLRANPALRGIEQQPAAVAAWLSGVILANARGRGARLVVTDEAVRWLQERLPAFGEGFAAFTAANGAQRLDPATGIAGIVVP